MTHYFTLLIANVCSAGQRTAWVVEACFVNNGETSFFLHIDLINNFASSFTHT
jgi:hypothetical protein